MAVLVLFSFALGLVITSGLSKTCDTILDINKEENQYVYFVLQVMWLKLCSAAVIAMYQMTVVSSTIMMSTLHR